MRVAYATAVGQRSTRVRAWIRDRQSAPAAQRPSSTCTPHTFPTRSCPSRRRSKRWRRWSERDWCGTSAVERDSRSARAGHGHPPDLRRAVRVVDVVPIDPDLLAVADRHGVGVVAWGPLGGGFLSGTVTELAAPRPPQQVPALRRGEPGTEQRPVRPDQGARRRTRPDQRAAGAGVVAASAPVGRSHSRQPHRRAHHREHRSRRHRAVVVDARSHRTGASRVSTRRSHDHGRGSTSAGGEVTMSADVRASPSGSPICGPWTRIRWSTRSTRTTSSWRT